MQRLTLFAEKNPTESSPLIQNHPIDIESRMPDVDIDHLIQLLTEKNNLARKARIKALAHSSGTILAFIGFITLFITAAIKQNDNVTELNTISHDLTGLLNENFHDHDLTLEENQGNMFFMYCAGPIWQISKDYVLRNCDNNSSTSGLNHPLPFCRNLSWRYCYELPHVNGMMDNAKTLSTYINIFAGILISFSILAVLYLIYDLLCLHRPCHYKKPNTLVSCFTENELNDLNATFKQLDLAMPNTTFIADVIEKLKSKKNVLTADTLFKSNQTKKALELFFPNDDVDKAIIKEIHIKSAYAPT